MEWRSSACDLPKQMAKFGKLGGKVQFPSDSHGLNVPNDSPIHPRV